MEKDIKTLFEAFISECTHSRRRSEATIRTYRHVFNHFLRELPYITSTDQITTDEVNKFFRIVSTRTRFVGKGVPRQGVKDSTIHTYASKLNSFFVWLSGREYIKVNPISLIPMPEPIYDDSRALEKQNVEKIYAAISVYSSNHFVQSRDRAIVSTLLFTGLRRGELVGLRVCDVDLKNNELTICGRTSKSKRTRYVPIIPVLRKHLVEYITERKEKGYVSPSLFVATNGDSGLTHDGYKHWVRRLGEKSGVCFHLHQFRHTFACNLHKQDVGLYDIMSLMGHTKSDMTMKYLRSIKPSDRMHQVSKLSVETLA
jgi:integrase